MSRFVFRLKTVGRLREVARDAARKQLGEAVQAANLLRDQIAEVDAQLVALVEDRRRATCGETMNVPLIAAAQRYEIAVRARQNQIREDLQRVEVEIDRRREALVITERDVRAIERLEERQRERYKLGMQRVEDRLLDEFASTNHRDLQKIESIS
jgi:flagellar protein FliJ